MTETITNKVVMEAKKYKLINTKMVINQNGKVSWADNWSILQGFERLGFLKHRFYGPNTYGHIEYLPTALFYQFAKEVTK
jgi:hypothetical protein